MRIFPLILLILSIFPLTGHSAEPGRKQTVLVIHSYHKEMQWVDEVQLGIEQTLIAAKGTSVDIRVEYMDSKRYTEAEYYALLASVWRYKYLADPPDSIIVCDDNALNLVLDLRQELFASIPLVFCGINYYDPEIFNTVTNITGVVEAYDLPGTLEIIKKLMPGHRDLFIINDSSLTGKANKSRLEEIAYRFSNSFNFTYSGNLSIEKLTEVVSTLPEGVVILLMTFNRDAENKVLRYRDAIKAIRSSTSRPIFGVWSFYLGRGIVGGSLVNGESQGRTAAGLTLQILDGAPASSLPVVQESPNLPMFDFSELQRFGVSLSSLPEGSTVINIPDNLWYRHRYKLLAGVVLLAAQFFIIALLLKNIRKRRRSEKKLRKHRQNLAITLEAIGDAVISVNTDYRIVRANHRAGQLLDRPVEHIRTASMTELLQQLDPVSGPALADLIRHCCTTGTPQYLPEGTTLTLPDRPPRYLSGSCSPIRTPGGTVQGVVLVWQDITEMHTMQSMLAQSRKMEAIGQLAGGVAHDFNNLLTGISGFAELLTLQLPAGSPESHNAGRILQAATRAADLTRKLLSFARKGRVVSSPVDCHVSLQSVLDLLQRSIDKSIRLIPDFSAERSVIIGDPAQLENTFLNLAINSADAMPDGGTLTISTENLDVTEPLPCEFGEILEPGTYILVRFSDTGCGMDPGLREKIFEPFFTTKVQGKGTGLGLAAVFGAMKEHDGRIQLRSTVGVGTDFLLYFPLEPLLLPEAAPRPALHDGGGATILVVDDERIILAAAKGLLSELGYRVLLAEGARAGIEIYRSHHKEIDLVLLDMIMPEMNGTTCFRELKSINPSVRAIICSGFTRTGKFSEAEELGVLDFVQKPYSAAEISSAIQGALHPLQK